MGPYSAVLFDLDGTLLDTAPDFYQVLVEMQRRREQPAADFNALRSCASDGARAMLKLAFGDTLEEHELKALVTEFLQLYEANPTAHGALFDGLSELLAELELRQIPWGIVTNKPRFLSEKVLRNLQLTERCAVLICPDDVSQAKPSPEGLLLAAKRLNIEPQQCIYLGDHQRDIDAGRAAGMTTLGCGYGYLKAGESAAQWRADLLAETSTELTDIVRDLLA